MNIHFFNNAKSIYIRLLASFVIITTLSVIMLSFILYINYQNSALDIINKSNRKILSKISYSANYMDELAKNFCISTYTDDDIISLIYSKTEDMFQIGNSIRKLYNSTVPVTYIQSIYIYNQSLDMYTSTVANSFYGSGDFPDKDIVNTVKNIKSRDLILVPIPRSIPKYGSNGSIDKINVYTYLMYNISNESSKIDGAVILNIKGDMLRNIILSMDSNTPDPNSDIFIMDKNGIIVSHSSPEMFLKDVTWERYVKRILSSNKDSDLFIDTVNNKKYVVTYVSSSLLNWKFVSLTPYQSIISAVQRVKVMTIVFCIFIIMLGLFFSVILSKKIYTPIGNLVNNVGKQLPVAYAEKNKDEMNFLSKAFSQVIDKANKLEKLKINSMQSLKNEFIKSILNGSLSISSGDLSIKLTELGINLKPQERMLLYILKVDNFRYFMENNNDKDRSLIKYSIGNIANEVTGQSFNNEVIDMGGDYVCVLLNIESSFMLSKNEIDDTIKSIILQIQEHIKNYFNLSLSAGVSYMIENIERINICYTDTLNIALYRIKYGHSSIIFPENLREVNSDEFKFPTAKEKLLLDSIKLGDLERAKDVYFQIINMLQNYSYDNIMSSIIYLTFTIYNFINTIEKNSISKISIDFNTFNEHISCLETLDEINRAFVKLFEEIISKMYEVRNKKSDSIVNNIIEIIKANYHDKNLCINSIAGIMKMSSVYLGKLFKDATSKSVAEYISEVRLEKVKLLLDTSNLKVTDILDKTGFEKTTYFYIIFKKHFGISLGEYRLHRSDIEKDSEEPDMEGSNKY